MSDHETSEPKAALPEHVTAQISESLGISPDELLRRLEQSRVPTENVAMQMEYLFRGPHPPPEMLKAYNEVDPTLADRIVGMTEKQVEGRLEIQKQMVDIQREDMREAHRHARIGLWLGWSIALAVVILAIVFAFTGNTALSAVALGIDVTALAAVFVHGSRKSGSPETESD